MHFTGWNPPQGYDTVSHGDTWARGTTGLTFTWDGTISAWLATTPLGAETNLLVPGGSLNQHLAKGGSQAANVRWVRAEEGLVSGPHALTPAGLEFQVQHSLQQQIVDVTVIPMIEGTWFGTPGTVIVPTVDFRTANVCVLHFAYPVIGTAFIRK